MKISLALEKIERVQTTRPPVEHGFSKAVMKELRDALLSIENEVKSFIGPVLMVTGLDPKGKSLEYTGEKLEAGLHETLETLDVDLAHREALKITRSRVQGFNKIGDPVSDFPLQMIPKARIEHSEFLNEHGERIPHPWTEETVTYLRDVYEGHTDTEDASPHLPAVIQGVRSAFENDTFDGFLAHLGHRLFRVKWTRMVISRMSERQEQKLRDKLAESQPEELVEA